MDRKTFLKSLAILPLTAVAMKLDALKPLLDSKDEEKITPALFVGHGSPMNAIEDNAFSREMKRIGTLLEKPKAILMISAHWETDGTKVTAQEKPPTIHDFGGFPKALFDAQYPAPGSKWLADETKSTVKSTEVHPDTSWGFDHGCWSVTKNMFPSAGVPIVQLSLDYTKDANYHYNLAKEIQALRKKGVMVIGSGNMVHNFGYVQVKDGDFNKPFGHEWALSANEKFKKLILDGDHKALIDYKNQGKEFQLSIPTPEHYLPLLYTLGTKQNNEEVHFFNDVALAGSFTMTSVMLGHKI